MARRCDYTGSGTTMGNNVSHSNRKTRRRFLVNLFSRWFVDPRTGLRFRAQVSARALRTLTKSPEKVVELAQKVVGKA